MSRVGGAGLLALLLLGACGRGTPAPEADAPVVAPSRVQGELGAVAVVLDEAERGRLGLVEEVVRGTRQAAERRLLGSVEPEAERVAVLRAPLAGRLAEPEGARWPAWGDVVEAGAVLGQVSDARPLAAPRAGTVTRVLAHPGEFVAAEQPLLELTDYSAPLVALTGFGLDTPPREVEVAPAATAARRRAALVGPAAEADPVTRQPAWLFRLERAWPGARPGQPVVGFLPEAGGRRREGVFVPDRAVVQWEGLPWAWVARGAGRYQRVALPPDGAVPGGFVVARGLAPGDRVVVRGAQQLLSEEFRSRVTVGDEQGDGD
ncbi:MAG: hypothetical protein NW201_01220 [Gemmatimonadales bacterium]|nr:hypothetical protein [Gemmatimonadales bacterium]